MDEKDSSLNLPFVTRDMLNFKEHATYDIRVVTRSRTAKTLLLTGATREGIFTFEFTVIAGTTTNTFGLPDLPIWISVGENSGNFENTEVYCKAYLRINGNRIHLLASGYITAGGGLSWPAIYNESPLLGIGDPVFVQSADPAAGNEAEYTHTRQTILKLDHAKINLVTDATSTTRRFNLSNLDAETADVSWFTISNVTQIQSLTRIYQASIMALPGTEILGTRVLVALPQDIYIKENDVVTASAENFQSGDNFGPLELYGREWINLGSVAAGD